MKKQYVVVFYNKRVVKTHTQGAQIVPYYQPITGAAPIAGGRYDEHGNPRTPVACNQNPPMVGCVVYESQTEAEKAAKDLLDMGFHNVGVFCKLGEFAPAEPTWKEVA